VRFTVPDYFRNLNTGGGPGAGIGECVMKWTAL
jgi:hypothetical protein